MYDAYVARFAADGARQWSTYLGGAGDDLATGIRLDPADNVLVVGNTSSTTGMATANAYQTALAGDSDGFLGKFDPAGVRRWGTYFGGAGFDVPTGLALSAYDRIAVVGGTDSQDGIATPGSFQPVYPGGDVDGFLVGFTQGQGLACAADVDCEAGFCVDGVCCDGPCGGDAPDCQACSVAAGASVDGTCTVAAAGATCRPAASECDAAELCIGDDPACPPDITAPDDTPCPDGTCLAGSCDPADASTTDAGTGTTDADTTLEPTSTSGSTSSATSDATSEDPGIPTGGDPGTSTGGDPGASDPGAVSDGSSTGPTSDGGCGCRQSPVPRDISLLALALLAVRRPRAHASRRRDRAAELHSVTVTSITVG